MEPPPSTGSSGTVGWENLLWGVPARWEDAIQWHAPPSAPPEPELIDLTRSPPPEPELLPPSPPPEVIDLRTPSPEVIDLRTPSPAELPPALSVGGGGGGDADCGGSTDDEGSASVVVFARLPRGLRRC